MVNGFRDLINWPAYHQKILDDKYNPIYYNDGEVTYMELNGALLSLAMKRNVEWEVFRMEVGDNVYVLADKGNVVRRSRDEDGMARESKDNFSRGGILLDQSNGNYARGARNNQEHRRPEGSDFRSADNNSKNVPVDASAKDTSVDFSEELDREYLSLAKDPVKNEAKIAYVKRYVEYASPEISKKIKNAETSGKTQLNLHSKDSIPQSAEKSTESAEKTDFSEELTTLSDLRKDNGRLRKQIVRLKGEMKVTEKTTVRRDDVEKLSR